MFLEGCTSFVDHLCFLLLIFCVFPMLSRLFVAVVVTCWESVDLLTLVGDFNCIFFYFPM